ncbi:MAG: hypothetical protein PHN56_03710 [Candidatus Nanoarchaeia archaeon]|nr:hypothetical protein [Candidatus Nanoarchaeia archaeon]
MIDELSDLAQDFSPVFINNSKDEHFNNTLIKVLEEYTIAVIESMANGRYEIIYIKP